MNGRRRLIRSSLVGGVAMGTCLQPGSAQTNSTSTGDNSMQLIQEWDKTFAKSDKVEHRKVTFKNRYGITLAADLYIPKGRDTQSLPALAISGPFGAVKEQS